MNVDSIIEFINLLSVYFEHSLSPITFTPFPHHKMLRKAMVGMAIVGLSAVDAYSVLQKRDGAGGHHDHAHEAPAPASGYDEPAAAYGAPAASYGAPAASYGAPAASYAEPAASYDAAPSYGAEEAALPDLTPIIIGILALVGLSLLFPTFVSVSARKKRSAAEGKKAPTMLMWALIDDVFGFPWFPWSSSSNLYFLPIYYYMHAYKIGLHEFIIPHEIVPILPPIFSHC